MALATNSFPVPVSPLIKTAASLPATRGTCSIARSKAGAWPIILVDDGESESRGPELRILPLPFHWQRSPIGLPRPTPNLQVELGIPQERCRNKRNIRRISIRLGYPKQGWPANSIQG